MLVSQTFIDLLGLPAANLRSLAKELDIAVPERPKHWDLASALQHVPREQLEEHSGDYLYAGSTSLSWFRLIDAEIDLEEVHNPFYPLMGDELSKDDIVDALSGQDEGDPFSDVIRPTQVTGRPQLVVARERDDGEFVLTFVVAKRLGHVIHNFESHAVIEDDFFNAFLRPGQGVFEVRASSARARMLSRTWLYDLAFRLGKQPVPVAITDSDYRALHDELGARLDVFKGKETAGTSVFDTRQFSKAENVNDLLEENEFLDATSGLETIGADLLFDFPEFGEVRVHVSTINGSIFIRTAVPEEVIRYVYDAVGRIK
jgi:hypothetical protein